MRTYATVSLLLMAALLLGTQSRFAVQEARTTRLMAEAVPLDASQPARRQVGKLTYLGGWSLRSADPRFGGLSSMHVEGGQVLAISDEGAVVQFAAPRRGTPTVTIRPLPGGPGRWASKATRDSESLIVHDGRAWIGFEGANAIWSYALPDFRPLGGTAPEAMRNWPDDLGDEAMVRLADGRFLIFAEGAFKSADVTEALLFDGDPARPGSHAISLGYRPPRGFKLSDAALLPDGRLLLVNRRYVKLEGVSVRLTVATLPALAPGAVIEGREIAYFRAPLTVDNFEAVSATQERGRTILWLASDDNFSSAQRTLLMKFMLEG